MRLDYHSKLVLQYIAIGVMCVRSS